jgi:hypothetical protein
MSATTFEHESVDNSFMLLSCMQKSLSTWNLLIKYVEPFTTINASVSVNATGGAISKLCATPRRCRGNAFDSMTDPDALNTCTAKFLTAWYIV